jgi:hypothetical protein
MPSLIRFLFFLGLLAALAYAGMFALVSLVEPIQREFVVMIPPDRLGKKTVSAANPKRKTEATVKDPLQGVEPDRLARVLESLHIAR